MENLPGSTSAAPDGSLPDAGVAGVPTGGDHLDRAVALDREINRLTALRARELHAHRTAGALAGDGSTDAADAAATGNGGELAFRAMRAEVAAALRVPERTVERLLECAATLVESLPATLALLESGTISYRHAVVMVDETLGLGDEDRASLEARVLQSAVEMTASAFRRRVRVGRERLHPETVQERHDAAKLTRAVTLEDIGEGMSILTATLPSPFAHAIFNRVTEAARGMNTPDDLRTLDQRRADLLSVVLMTGESDGAPFGVIPGDNDAETVVKWFRGITPEVFITVPALTLLGRSDQPAMLDGLIPIDPTTARILVGNATSFTRVLTDPETGATLSVGRNRYVVPKDLRRYLLLRDLTCRFPGCYQPATRCDLDHTVEWQYGGHTGHDNLANLCRNHHVIKGETDWKVEQDPGGSGVLSWLSPNGRSYTTYPGTRLAG